MTWTSTDTSVATVDSSGTVTAKGFGCTTIVAEADERYDVCTVTVVKTDVSSITLSSTSKTLETGDTVTLTATVSPSDATYPTVIWTSSDTSVATVDDSGKITAVAEGAATITAEADGEYDVCTVTVTDYADIVSDVSLSSTSETLDVGDTVTLTATVSPNSAASVTWTSSDTSVATVSGGKVTAVAEGAVTIIADADGVYAVCTIAVSDAGTEDEDTTDNAEDVPDTGEEDADNTDYDETSTVTPSVVEEDEEAGTVTITISTGDLPEGTEQIKLANGDIIDVGDQDTVTITVGSDELDEDGTLEIVALDEEAIPLGMYEVQTGQKIIILDTGSVWSSFWQVFKWILIGIAGIGGMSIIVYLLLRKRRSA